MHFQFLASKVPYWVKLIGLSKYIEDVELVVEPAPSSMKKVPNPVTIVDQSQVEKTKEKEDLKPTVNVQTAHSIRDNFVTILSQIYH